MRKSPLLKLLLLVGLLTQVQGLQAQDQIKVLQYNLLRYGAAGISGCTPTGVTARNAWFTTIINELMPDVFGVNEIGPNNGITSPATNILNNILKPLNPNYERATVTFNGSQDIANAFFYNTTKLALHSQSVIPHPLRNIDYFHMYYKGPGLAAGDTTWLDFVVVHLHSSDAAQRSQQTAAIMTYLDGLGYPGNFIVMGDMNMDGSTAGAYQNMVAHANTDTKMNDPINLNGTWSNNTNAKHAWSQSTRTSSTNDCGSAGGLDDRFDIILASNQIMNNTDDVRYLPGSYRIVGNPNSPNPAVPSGVTAALIPMSDHHPVMLTLEVSRAVANANPIPGFELMLRAQPCDQVLSATMLVPGGMEGNWRLSISDLQGRNLLQQDMLAAAGNQAISLPTQNLAAGLYILQVQSPQGVAVAKRFAVQRN